MGFLFINAPENKIDSKMEITVHNKLNNIPFIQSVSCFKTQCSDTIKAIFRIQVIKKT